MTIYMHSFVVFLSIALCSPVWAAGAKSKTRDCKPEASCKKQDNRRTKTDIMLDYLRKRGVEIKEYAIEVKKSATRLKSVASALEDPWKIDVTEDMDFCFYKESEGIKLWREDARRTNTLLIEKDGKEEKSRWIPDETDISWPYRQFPIKNGEVYDITLEGADGDPIEITSIVFHDISVVTDKDALKAKLDLCYRQTVLWTQAAENKR